MMGFGTNERSNRFVCPNDRQLSLRAKLNTGWSVKTETLGYNSKVSKSPSIAADEQDAIVQVIQRAEQLDVSEQERIGKLVERLETMRRNALGRNSSQCLLCGDGFGILGAQKVMCMDCRRLACQKCVIDSNAGTTNSTPRPPRERWLCMICAETREMWKKSGAWFFKGLPKYTLPTEAAPPPQRCPRSRSVRVPRRCRDEDSSSEEERRAVNRRQRRSSGTESSQGAIDQEQGHTPLPNSRQTSSSESQISKDIEPLRSNMSSMTLSDAKYCEDSGTEDRRGDTVSLTASRRESMTSRSMSDWICTENRSEEKVSPSTCSIIKPPLMPDPNKPPSNPTMGIVELSLTYDPQLATLHCTVYRAKNLPATDMSGLADPFCKVDVVPSTGRRTRLRTRTVHKTRAPEFNESLTFFEVDEAAVAQRALHLLVVDDDRFGEDYMGEVRVELARLKYQNTIYLSVPLEDLRTEHKGPVPTPELNDWFDDLCSRGQILLSLCYNTKKRALLVTVAKCVNLLPMDNNGLSDPFVKLQLKPDPNHKKHKTSIKWKNLNPEWNEEFAFETRPNELYTQSLYITVFDKDYGKSNDYLGGLILGGTGSKGLRLKHWMDMIRYPDHRHEQWHNLTEEILE